MAKETHHETHHTTKDQEPKEKAQTPPSGTTTITAYNVLAGANPVELASLVTAALADGWQPFGNPILAVGTADNRAGVLQAVVKQTTAAA